MTYKFGQLLTFKRYMNLNWRLLVTKHNDKAYELFFMILHRKSVKYGIMIKYCMFNPMKYGIIIKYCMSENVILFLQGRKYCIIFVIEKNGFLLGYGVFFFVVYNFIKYGIWH